MFAVFPDEIILETDACALLTTIAHNLTLLVRTPSHGPLSAPLALTTGSSIIILDADPSVARLAE